MAGEPLSNPVLGSRVTPLGSGSTVLKVGAGKPVALKVKMEGPPTTKEGSGPALIMAGASFTVRVNVWSIKPALLVARTVKV